MYYFRDQQEPEMNSIKKWLYEYEKLYLRSERLRPETFADEINLINNKLNL